MAPKQTKILILAAVVLVGGVIGVMGYRSTMQQEPAPVASQTEPATSSSTVATEAEAATATATEPMETSALITPRVLGNLDAPVTIVEYSSLTCPHCAAFHRETLPQLKKEYIDTGKVKLEIRDFPLDNGAALAALMARCAPEERYFALMDLLFAQQSKWAREQGMLQELAKLGGFAGMSNEQLETCFANEELYKAIVDQRKIWTTVDEIRSTPTFYVNGKQVVGAQPFDAFKELIDAELN